MAKIDLKFLCDTGGNDSYIKCQVCSEEDRHSTIKIEISDPIATDEITSIFLDKSTAIKFAKTLRTEINKMTE